MPQDRAASAREKLASGARRFKNTAHSQTGSGRAASQCHRSRALGGASSSPARCAANPDRPVCARRAPHAARAIQLPSV